ncbi:hypothetical protein NIES592_08065 [Fischerella major NIES-592]|uniref:Uncharacterized protein n=1 Tax=Fischerella major NIES-592 TaxID=210994 RepID=A0A1U7H1E4_9CYAN|nr:hypothetical protein [Fischerella major]OKH14822.1 hypothetical protein NIES592_08065 [Fischerella major NIES-592]
MSIAALAKAIVTAFRQEFSSTNPLPVSGGSGGGGGDASSVNQLTEISRLEAIRDRLPSNGTASEATLDFIKNNLPSATNPSLIRSILRKWREEFNGTSLSSDWTINQTGAGQSITVSASELTIAAGTSANAETIITSTLSFKIPFRVLFTFTLSQRISNQEFYLEIVDSSGNHRASVLLDATSSNTVKLNCANESNSTGSISNTGFSTSSYGIAELEVNSDEVNLYSRSANSSNGRGSASVVITRQIPDPSLDYFVRIRAKNLGTAPASNTNLKLDAIVIQDIEEITAEITAGRGGGGGQNQSVPVAINNVPSVNISGTPTVSINRNNSTSQITSTPLTANANYTSSAQFLSEYSVIRGWVHTDQPGTLVLEQSHTTTDTSFKQIESSISCVAGITTFEQKVYGAYARVNYTNGSNAQGSFSIVFSRCTSF